MYALKYGSVPLVRATGGLEDSVRAFEPPAGNGNGFKFQSLESKDLLKSVREALDLFGDHRVWNRIMDNGMNADFSWDRSAEKYMALYQRTVEAAH
jgi:starch synthase